jgi:hypothetical protein
MTTKLTTDNGQRTTNKQDWRLYAAAGAAALAAGSAADASIIYGNLNVDLTIPNGAPAHASTVKKTFTIDGVVESAVLRRAPGGTGGPGAFFASAKVGGPLNVFVFGSSVSAAVNFGKGQAIGGNYLLAGLETLAGREGNEVPEDGLFTGGRIGYAGFQLGNGDLGWLQIQVPTNNAYPDELKILGYAYNDASGAPINAGQGASVPEPSALGLLALGSAGVLAWRRRRV